MPPITGVRSTWPDDRSVSTRSHTGYVWLNEPCSVTALPTSGSRLKLSGSGPQPILPILPWGAPSAATAAGHGHAGAVYHQVGADAPRQVLDHSRGSCASTADGLVGAHLPGDVEAQVVDIQPEHDDLARSSQARHGQCISPIIPGPWMTTTSPSLTMFFSIRAL